MNTKTALVLGGTDGIGAATALELYKHGARVIIVGRSEEKAKQVLHAAQSIGSGGSMEYIVSDLSLMQNVKNAVNIMKDKAAVLDIVVYTVGILISQTEHTSEGIEKDFAVSYLSRFVCMEELHAKGLLNGNTLLLNVAASAPKVPTYAQMEFHTLQDVQARVGMKSHGQAQLANDLFVGFAASRYGITSVGYGPGSVNTSIRRELPPFLVALMKPFFYFSTREPQDVAQQLVAILGRPDLQRGKAQYFDKNGAFPVSPFIADSTRQNALLNTSVALMRQALAS
jgi:NAD(P)-dependent dehydrogenase (short-subunit alcohol dehydrogenase family)